MNAHLMIVNDYAGVGKVAANVLFPIFSVAQVEPVVLPTLLLSSNLGAAAGEVVTQSTADIFSPYLGHWKEMDFHFSHYVTGYFDTVDQITEFKDYYLREADAHPEIQLFVDPTMGDKGHLYSSFNPRVPDEIGQLIPHAHLVKPNLTEACLLTGHPYSEDMPKDEILDVARKLHELGADHTVITGLKEGDGPAGRRIGFAYVDEDGRAGTVTHKYYDEDFFGTGDLVFSLMIIGLLYGMDLRQSLEMTATLTEKVIEETLKLERDRRYGLCFESIYGDLLKIIQNS